MRLAARGPGVPGALALGTLALLATSIATCEPADRLDAPAIVASNGRYTVLWERPARNGGAMFVQQFGPDSAARSKPIEIVRRDDLVLGSNELVAIGDGYLAVGRVEDPEKKPNWATHMLFAPLDGNGAPAGELRQYSFDYACGGSGVVGDMMLVAYKEIARSHRYPYDVLGVLAVDRMGRYRGRWRISNTARGCASAVRGGEIAVAWTRHVDDEDLTKYGLRVSFGEPKQDGRDDTYAIPVGDVSPWPVRIAPHGDNWAILYGDRGNALHVAVVTPRGDLERIIDLPGEISGHAVDLGSNARGLFVTWVDGGRVRTRGVEGTFAANVSAGSRASAPRSVGDGRACVSAWTVGDGKGIRVATSTDCP